MNRVVACSARQVRLGRMVRRSESQFKVNDRAFPIRVKFVVPPGGLRTLEVGINVHEWLKNQLDHLAWAWGPADSTACQATAYYFRSLDDAQRFVAAFPQLELADGVRSPVYTAPGKGPGPKSVMLPGQDGA